MVLLLLLLAWALCLALGFIWGRAQRRKAVEEAYQAILEEIRRERESGEETVSIITWRF